MEQQLGYKVSFSDIKGGTFSKSPTRILPSATATTDLNRCKPFRRLMLALFGSALGARTCYI